MSTKTPTLLPFVALLVLLAGGALLQQRVSADPAFASSAGGGGGAYERRQLYIDALDEHEAHEEREFAYRPLAVGHTVVDGLNETLGRQGHEVVELDAQRVDAQIHYTIGARVNGECAVEVVDSFDQI